MTTETAFAPTAAEQQETLDQLIQITKGRAATYSLLARLYRLEVDQEMLDALKAMPFPAHTGNTDADEGNRLICSYLSNCDSRAITELAVDYVRTFIGAGNDGFSAAYPFESVYTSERRLLMQEARAEVLAAFRENNLKKDRWTEGEDHIALELEFMQRLSLRTAEAIAAENDDEAIELVRRQYAFLQDHLLNWVPMFVSDMRMFAKTLFYQGVAQLLMGFLEEDEAVLTALLESVTEDE